MAEKARSVETVFTGTVNVPAGQTHAIAAEVAESAQNPKLVGYAEARGASSNVRLLVFADDGQRLLYDSGPQRAPRMNVTVKKPGTYQVVLDAGSSQKMVFASVSIEQSAEAGQQRAQATGKP